MNQLREQEQAAQREQELLTQKQAAQEKEDHHKTLTFEVKNIIEQATKRRTRITEFLQKFKIIHKKSSISLNNTPQISSVIAITPNLPTKEPEYSLSIGDEHLSTIPETESDEVIKSSFKNLVPILSESEVTFDNESECDEPVNDESSPIFTTFSNPLFDCNDDFTSSDDKSLSNEDVSMENFKIYSNPLFDDEEIISTKIDPHYFNAESNLLESLLDRDTLIDSSLKFDYLLEEFSGELAHINPIPPGVEEADFDLEEEIRLVENFCMIINLHDRRKNLMWKLLIRFLSLSPSPIPVEDSDSHMEEIDLFLATDDLIPPGIKNKDYDSEGDIHFLKELLSNDTFSLPENELSNFDHHDDPSFLRPPPKPPDIEIFFDFEPDTDVLTMKVVKGISEHYVLMPNILPTLSTLDPDLNFTPSHDSLGSRNKILIQGYSLKSNPPNPPFVQILIFCSRFHPKTRTKCSNPVTDMTKVDQNEAKTNNSGMGLERARKNPKLKAYPYSTD
nr:hypothetical protein [Tanacetum cinerariifolium]